MGRTLRLTMRAAGLRVRKGEGNHAITAAYASAAIADELGERLDAARRRRNRSEYGSAYFDSNAVNDVIELASALIDAIDS